MDTKYTDASWCPERKSIVALRLFKGKLSYLAYFSQTIKGSMAPVSFEAMLLGSENQEERSVH